MAETFNTETKDINYKTIKESLKLCFRFNKYILRYWKQQLFLFILAGLSVVFSLLTPYLGKIILDKGILARNLTTFITFTIIAVGVNFLNSALGNLNNILSAYVARKVRIDLSKRALRKVSRLSLRFFRDRSTGEFIYRINSDISSSAGIIVSTLPNILQAFFKLISITIVILFINYKIWFLVLAYQILVMLRIKLFARETEALMRKGIENSQRVMKVLSEFFSHVYFLKFSGKMTNMVQKYFHTLAENMRLEVERTKLGLKTGAFSGLSNQVFFGLIGFAGSILVIKGKLTLGSLGAIMAYLSQGTGAYSAVLDLGRQIVLNRISLERLTEVLDSRVDVEEKEDAKDLSLLGGRIEFRDVSFGYDEDRFVIQNLNFSIPPKSKIALIGHSGIGKTTLLNLILRLYDVNAGAILVEDFDIKDMRFKSIYRQIAYAPQIPYLWNDTIRYNIAYENSKMDDEELIEITRLSEMHSFIQDLPKGFDTVVGEEGCQISQGQKQRLSVARALAKKPRILLLDEAFSSVDSETEEKIIENIKNVFGDSTVIIVSHRLATVKKMELVYFLENQSKIHIGTHEQLMGSNHQYKELFAGQIENEGNHILRS
jgi:ATP-binding cassette subfamily B protein